MNDKQLKEQIDSLDTLSGGIVFGREEAWDKLQARMDKKPAKRVWLNYKSLAAAAILLLLVSLGVIYNSTDREIATVTDKPAKPLEDNKVGIAVKPDTTAVNNPMPTSQLPTAKPNETRKQAYSVSIAPPPPTTPPMASQQQAQPTDSEARQAELATNTAATPVIKPMRILHINELEHRVSAPAITTPKVEQPSVALDGKLPVIHINELIRTEAEERRILKENRMGTGYQPFIRINLGHEDAPAATQHNSFPNRFQLKLNIQN